MVSWEKLSDACPDLVGAAEPILDANRHKVLATLREDGSPRVSGIEVQWARGDAWIGSMPDAVKVHDLRRDGRFALHCGPSDPSDDGERWSGDVKFAGRAHEVEEQDPAYGQVMEDQAGTGAHLFRLDVTELVLTRVAGRQLEVWSWNERRGEERALRD